MLGGTSSELCAQELNWFSMCSGTGLFWTKLVQNDVLRSEDLC
jgi:hypothetical protein